MSDSGETQSELTENPLLIYINRLQRQMLIITDMLYNSRIDVNSLKRSISGLICNLPPKGIERFQNALNILEGSRYVPLNSLSMFYREIHSYAYTVLFQEFNLTLTHTVTLPGTKEKPKHEALNPNQSSRV